MSSCVNNIMYSINYRIIKRHSRAGGNPVAKEKMFAKLLWIPACAGMTSKKRWK